MNSLIGYSFKDQILRTQLTDAGEPLFCLTDICQALELANPSHVANSVKEEFETPTLNVGVIQRETGPVEATFITEPQLYYVLMRSRAKNARPFRQWVVNEVLPSIRKKGYYEMNQKKEVDYESLKKELEAAAIILKSDNPQELDALYKAKTGESLLEKIKENMPNAD